MTEEMLKHYHFDYNSNLQVKTRTLQSRRFLNGNIISIKIIIKLLKNNHFFPGCKKPCRRISICSISGWPIYILLTDGTDVSDSVQIRKVVWFTISILFFKAELQSYKFKQLPRVTASLRQNHNHPPDRW